MAHLESRDIKLINYSWVSLAPSLGMITVFFFNELYTKDLNKIPAVKVDMNKFSAKALNTFGFMIANLNNLLEVKDSLESLLIDLHKYGQLSGFTEAVLKKALDNSIKKGLGKKWKLEHSIAWLKLAQVIEQGIINLEEKKRKVDIPKWIINNILWKTG